MFTLQGNVSPEVKRNNDLGRIPDEQRLEHIYLQLKRSPERQGSLERFVEHLHDPASPSFHQWLTAEQLGERFGPSDREIASVQDWLKSYGIKVNAVFPSKMTLDFSGTGGEIRKAFRTEIHRFVAGGRHHVANVTDPQIPTTLAPVVAGVVALHDFHSRALPANSPAAPNETFGGGRYLAPADLATIYNFGPLYDLGLSGTGQTIV